MSRAEEDRKPLQIDYTRDFKVLKSRLPVGQYRVTDLGQD